LNVGSHSDVPLVDSLQLAAFRSSQERQSQYGTLLRCFRQSPSCWNELRNDQPCGPPVEIPKHPQVKRRERPLKSQPK
jgi:hypothetical protein